MNNQLSRHESASLWDQFESCRNNSIAICEELSDEDIQAQSMPDASPLKWHLAHTTWAFETFILKPYCDDYIVFDNAFEYLFNSYYNAIGAQFPRPDRGLLTRPNRQTVMDYRRYVDLAMEKLISQQLLTDPQKNNSLRQLLLLVINHEQQHQELMLTDLKHLLYVNPCFPIYRDIEHLSPCLANESITFEPGIYPIGHNDEDFYFDNEGPRHQFYASRFAIHTQLVSNGDYLAFLEDGGYQQAAHWLSEAWQKISQQQIRQPYYWVKRPNGWYEYTLGGLKPLDLNQPVKHISYFEANAYANWRGLRLPTEQEWEIASRSKHPAFNQLFNQLWQWTSSSYCAYPGFKPVEGAIGEYNGKFMVNQYVLRGGSIATPSGHIRPSYRNFFYPDARWQYSGIRLAETI